jgi:hypothetical protein
VKFNGTRPARCHIKLVARRVRQASPRRHGSGGCAATVLVRQLRLFCSSSGRPATQPLSVIGMLLR